MGLFKHRADDGCFDEPDRDALVRTERRADQMRDYRQYYSSFGDEYDQVYGGVMESDVDDPLRGYDDGSVDDRIRRNRREESFNQKNIKRKASASEKAKARQAATKERIRKERERREKNKDIYRMDESRTSYSDVPPTRRAYGYGGEGAERSRRSGRFGTGLILGLILGFIIGVIATVVGAIAFVGYYEDNIAMDDWWNLDEVSYDGEILDDATEEKIEQLGSYIMNDYYEDVDIEDVRNGLISGMFDNLDVYSRYYTEEEYNDLFESTITGSYCGIGAQLQQGPDGVVTIVHVYADSPAEEYGLKDGDQIVSVTYEDEEYEATGSDLTELVSHIRGEEGTKVGIHIYRESTAEFLDFEIPRRNLAFETVTHQMLQNETGYIDISEFSDTTVGQFEEAIDELESEGMESLIIDLRANPGGSLDAVEAMVDYILDEDKLVVYMKDKDGDPYDEYYTCDGHQVDLPIVVLVDENSASAAEIMTAALKDHEAAYIIGTNTFGKGVVQTLRSLTDGSGFKLTTSRYYTPNDECIHGIGIAPDHELEFEFLGSEEDAYSVDLDNQIQYAIEYLNKQ